MQPTNAYRLIAESNFVTGDGFRAGLADPSKLTILSVSGIQSGFDPDTGLQWNGGISKSELEVSIRFIPDFKSESALIIFPRHLFYKIPMGQYNMKFERVPGGVGIIFDG